MLEKEIARFHESVLREFFNAAPWELTCNSVNIVELLLNQLDNDYIVSDKNAIHKTSIIESGSIIKAPSIIGPNCFIAAGAYIRGGCWLEENCIIGPGAELKSSFIFGGTKLAHFNFVGDSILGHDVNLEAGAIIANYRNEQANSIISFLHNGKRIDTGVKKFGAVVGDRTKIGANAVIAPGAIIPPDTIVKRLSLIDRGDCE